MAPIEQHRGFAVAGGELEAPCGGHVGGANLGDHAGQRSVAQAVLGNGQHLLILFALSVEYLRRAKADLFEAGSIEVEAGQCPEHGKSGTGEARGKAGGKERGGGIVAPARGSGGDFVEACAVQTSKGEPVIQHGDAEGQDGAAIRARVGQLRAQGVELITAGGRESGVGLHGGETTL